MDKLIADIRERGWAWSIEPSEMMAGDGKYIAIEYLARVWNTKQSVEASNNNPTVALGMAAGGLKAMVDHD